MDISYIGWQIAYGIIASLLTLLLVGLLKRVYVKIKYRSLNKFWKPLIGQKIALVLTEYPSSGKDLNAKTAQKVSNGFLITRGNALALSNLMNYLPKRVTSYDNLCVGGDKSGFSSYENLVIIGSPANNLFAQNVYNKVKEKYTIPFSIEYNTTSGEISFSLKDDGKQFHPRIENGNGIDYAIIIKTQYRTFPTKYAIILSGAYMFGAQAASYAVSNNDILRKICKKLGNSDNCVFLIKTNVINYYPSEPELEIDNSFFIYPLISKVEKVSTNSIREREKNESNDCDRHQTTNY